jgi:HSP20 family molecular chaperone IbpA
MLHYTTQDPIFDALFGLHPSTRRANYKPRQPSFATPNTDILESNEAYKVVVQLPGVAKENITIDFEENTLTVATKESESEPVSEKADGEVSEELESVSESESANETKITPKVEEFKTHIKQISSKLYKKSIEFPTQVDYESISADYTNGLLTILLPKSAKHHKTISIL